MIKLLFSYFSNTLNISLFVLLLLLLEPMLRKRYSAKCIYSIWIVLLIGFLIPIRFELVQPLYHLGVPNITANYDSDNIESKILYEDSERTQTKDLAAQASINNTTTSNDTALFPEAHFMKQLLMVMSSFLLNYRYLILCFVWVIGALLFIGLNGISFLRYKKKIEKYIIPVDDETIPDEIKLSIYKSRRNIMIYRCSVISSPMSIGILRPLVLLPVRQYSERDLYYLLQHELTHMRRLDSLIKLTVLITLSLNWFNPICFVLSKHIDYWCEVSCDEIVLKKSTRSDCMYYGKLLLSCASSMNYQSCPALFTSFYGGKNNMKQRLNQILNQSKKQSGKIIIPVLCIMVATIAVFAIGKSNVLASDHNDESVDNQAVITPALITNGDVNVKNNNTDIKSPDVKGQSDNDSIKSNSDSITSDNKTNIDSIRDSIVSYALDAKANNTPYIWGGNDLVTGVDCSGLVQAAYKKAGYDLPRTSSKQFDACEEVSIDNLQPGDLVFYNISNSNQINHVGIYIGDGQIIHAKNAKDNIVICDVNYRKPACAGRIISD